MPCADQALEASASHGCKWSDRVPIRTPFFLLTEPVLLQLSAFLSSYAAVMSSSNQTRANIFTLLILIFQSYVSASRQQLENESIFVPICEGKKHCNRIKCILLGPIYLDVESKMYFWQIPDRHVNSAESWRHFSRRISSDISCASVTNFPPVTLSCVLFLSDVICCSQSCHLFFYKDHCAFSVQWQGCGCFTEFTVDIFLTSGGTRKVSAALACNTRLPRFTCGPFPPRTGKAEG